MTIVNVPCRAKILNECLCAVVSDFSNNAMKILMTSNTSSLSLVCCCKLARYDDWVYYVCCVMNELYSVSLISSTAKAAQWCKERGMEFVGAVVMLRCWLMAHSGGCWWLKLDYVNVN